MYISIISYKKVMVVSDLDLDPPPDLQANHHSKCYFHQCSQEEPV